MIVDAVTTLNLVCVLDRGIPNKECIAIYVREPVDLGQYGVTLGFRLPNGLAQPMRDAFFWFGDGIVNAGDWILLFTGGGNSTISDGVEEGSKTYSLHWGRSHTIFAYGNVVPVLFRIDQVALEPIAENQPQLGDGEHMLKLESESS